MRGWASHRADSDSSRRAVRPRPRAAPGSGAALGLLLLSHVVRGVSVLVSLLAVLVAVLVHVASSGRSAANVPIRPDDITRRNPPETAHPSLRISKLAAACPPRPDHHPECA